MRRIVYLLSLLAISCSVLLRAETVSLHTTTDWELKPSLKYDTLCLLNALSGDAYYLHYYQAEYDHFHPLFTPEEQAEFDWWRQGSAGMIEEVEALAEEMQKDEEGRSLAG